ncbi:hypothetical protein NDU88_009058 [Pleurodeles waltl]|uniref:Uncharacterized protein n=1 Tax=Pleurodeles waltl TaxID=8319 RepID=A0AAV7QWJ6_PLEWA|nr:hypothetical protein NDU88_009058 [Pleurodeles waltl]
MGSSSREGEDVEASKASMTDSGTPVAAGRERLIEVTLLTGQSLSKVSGWEDPGAESKGTLGFDEGTEDTGAEDSLLISHTTELKMVGKDDKLSMIGEQQHDGCT